MSHEHTKREQRPTEPLPEGQVWVWLNGHPEPHWEPRGTGLVRPGLSVPAPTLVPCRECQEGKHGNCDGDTWDDVADDYAPCPCANRGHVSTPTAPPA